MVDKDYREIEAIQEVFPEAVVLLCPPGTVSRNNQLINMLYRFHFKKSFIIILLSLVNSNSHGVMCLTTIYFYAYYSVILKSRKTDFILCISIIADREK